MMHAELITGGSQELRRETLQKRQKELNASAYDTIVLSDEHNGTGIAAVRAAIQSLFRSPAYGPVRVLLIPAADTLSAEAQNALLKTLEEPPPHAVIFLETGYPDALLPTVRSRCRTVRLLPPETPPDEENETLPAFFGKLVPASPGETLLLLEPVTANREEAVAWIDRAVVALRRTMLRSASGNAGEGESAITGVRSAAYLKSLIKARSEILGNVNHRLALENAILSVKSS